MTTPLPPPRKKNPVERTRQPTQPPANRSREAHGLTAMAARGRFALQVCADCGAVQYPPCQVCGGCLGGTLVWRDQPNGGRLLAETTLRHSNDLFFRDNLPWRLGMVASDAGPSIVAHLAEDCRRGMRVRLTLSLDRSGNTVVAARPERTGENDADDRALREMAMDPKQRRVLIVDGKNAMGLALARAFADAGAREIYLGESLPWRASPELEAARALTNVTVFPLDVTDGDSVEDLAAILGGKTEILVNNVDHFRYAGAADAGDLNIARQQMDLHYFGLLRLAGAFGPALRGRGADGAHGARAWVNVLSAHALVSHRQLGSYAASMAAALSLSHCLRAEMAGGGIGVLNAFVGPIEDEWRQRIPPPKLEPGAVARRIVDALRAGHEDVAIGAVAEEILQRRDENPKELERAYSL